MKSQFFAGDSALREAAVDDRAHIVPGATGAHVAKLQTALMWLDWVKIDPLELAESRYGASTANAVLKYKVKRKIINPSYQQKADNIVGKMTIARLDADLLSRELNLLREDFWVPPGRPDPDPYFDIIAPDGFVIPRPRSYAVHGRRILLDNVTVSVFNKSGRYVVTLDNLHTSSSSPNAKAAAKGAAEGAAKRAVSQALKRLPDTARTCLSWTGGKLAGGIVSAIGTVLDPSDLSKEIIWHVEIDGRPVTYTLLTQ